MLPDNGAIPGTHLYDTWTWWNIKSSISPWEFHSRIHAPSVPSCSIPSLDDILLFFPWNHHVCWVSPIMIPIAQVDPRTTIARLLVLERSAAVPSLLLSIIYLGEPSKWEDFLMMFWSSFLAMTLWAAWSLPFNLCSLFSKQCTIFDGEIPHGPHNSQKILTTTSKSQWIPPFSSLFHVFHA